MAGIPGVMVGTRSHKVGGFVGSIYSPQRNAHIELSTNTSVLAFITLVWFILLYKAVYKR